MKEARLATRAKSVRLIPLHTYMSNGMPGNNLFARKRQIP